MRKLNKMLTGYLTGIIAAYATIGVDAKLGIWKYIGTNDAHIWRLSNLSFLLIMTVCAVSVWHTASHTKDSYDFEREEDSSTDEE